MNLGNWIIIFLFILYAVFSSWLVDEQGKQSMQFMDERDSARQGMIVAYLEMERMIVAHEREKSMLQHELYVAWTDVCMSYKKPKGKNYRKVEKQCQMVAIKALNRLYGEENNGSKTQVSHQVGS